MTPARLAALVLLLVPSTLLFAQQPEPAVAPSGQLVGNERPLSAAAPSSSNAVVAQTTLRRSAVASNGAEALAVWQDRRSEITTDLYAARVGTNGELLDARTIRISDNVLMEENPFVTWNGSVFVVVWTAQSLNSEERHQYASEVSRDGLLLTASPIEISSNGVLRDVASSNGNTCVLVTSGDPDSPSAATYAYTLDSDAAPIRATFISSGPDVPAVSASASGFYVALGRYNAAGPTEAILGMRLNVNGTPADPAPVPLTTVAAPGGPMSLVASAFPSRTDVVIAAIRQTLTVVRVAANGSTQVATLGANDSETASSILAAADGSFALATYWQPPAGAAAHLLVRRITAADTLLGTPRDLAPPLLGPGALADLAGRPYAVWPAAPAGTTGPNLVGAFYDEGSDAVLLSRAAVTQHAPALGSSTFEALAAWTDIRADGSGDDVFIRRLTTDGTPAGNALQLSTLSPASTPAVTFAGTGYLVAWLEEREGGPYKTLMLRRVTRDAAPDGGELVVTRQASSSGAPKLAADGTNALLAWSDGNAGSPLAYAALVTPGGVAAPFVIGGQRTPTVASNNLNYLAATVGSSSIVATVITRGGAVSSIQSVTSPGTSVDDSPAVASNGTDYFLVWSRSGTLMGRFFDRAGLPSGNELVIAPAVTTGLQQLYASAPAVTWDGVAWVVTWTRSNTADAYSYGDIVGRRISTTGELQNSLDLSITAGDERAVALTPLARGRVLAAYTRVAQEAEDVHRVFTRTVTFVVGASRHRAARH